MEYYYHETDLEPHSIGNLGAQAIEFALFDAQAELPFGVDECVIEEVSDSEIQMAIQGEFDIEYSKELGK